MRNLSILCLLAAVLLSQPVFAAYDLLDIYEQAYRQDPDLASARAQAGGADARYRQARGQLLPNLSGSASYSRLKSIDKSDESIFDRVPAGSTGGGSGTGGAGTGGGTGTIFTDDSNPGYQPQKSLSLDLRQPLFDWSAYQAKDAAAARSDQAEANLGAAQQLLIVTTAQRYFDVLAAQEALAAAKEQQKLISRQLDRAKASYESGLIPITDKLEAQSQLDSTRVDAIQARNQLRRSRQSLSQLIGRAPGELARVDGAIKPVPLSQKADKWVQSGLASSPTVAAAKLGLRAAQKDIRKARGGHYPTLDFVASVGQTENTFNFGGALSTSITERRSFGLELTVPLFAGFTVNAQVSEAQYASEQARQDLISATRQVRLDVKTAYGDLQAAGARINALNAAIKSGDAAAKAAKAGLETGTRNILDVLQADIDLVQRKTNLKQAWYDYLNAGLRLRQAAGVLAPSDLVQVNARLTSATTGAGP